MGLLSPDRRGDEDEGDVGRGLELDLEIKACPVCRREVLPWQTRCPEHDAEAVPRSDLPPTDGPPVPEHLREEPDDAPDDRA